MTNLKKYNLPFLGILLVYTIYAAVYIYQTSFIVAGERYFVLFDDAMISMRYARNLAHGDGLVWNPGGARVEGYTNPLWVVFMAAFHLLPLPASKISVLIQASGAFFLILNLKYVLKIADLITGSPAVSLLAVILTAFYNPLNNWGLQGMEVSVLMLMITAAIWLSLNCLQNRSFSPWLYLLLGLSTLVRIDMAVPYIVILTVLSFALAEHRRRNLSWGLGILFLFLISQTVFRLSYYGDLLPNTYYLKMTGYPLYLRVAHGLYVMLKFMVQMNWVLFLIPFFALIIRRDYTIVLLTLVFLGQVAYSVYVGGDAWEHRGGSNRYIAIAMPLFFILFIYTANHIREVLINSISPKSIRVRLFSNLGLLLFVLGSMINFNYLTNLRSLERWALLRQPLFIEGNKEYVQIAVAVDKITTPQANIAVVSAGAIPYFSNRPAIDLLGKNDPVIARQQVHWKSGLANISEFRPGHLKWDYSYSIGVLKPDVVVQLWGDTEEARTYLDNNYVVGGAPDDLPFSLRVDSANIRWEQVQLAP